MGRVRGADGGFISPTSGRVLHQALGSHTGIDHGTWVLSFRIIWYDVLHWHSIFQEHHLVPVLVAFTPFGSHQMSPALDSPDGKYVAGGWEIGWGKEILVGVDANTGQVCVCR